MVLRVNIDRLWWKDTSGQLYRADNIPTNGSAQLAPSCLA